MKVKTFNVVIKGDLIEVRDLMEKRGICLRNPKPVAGSVVGFFAETEVNEHYLNQWFCGGEPSAPFPPGTLMHWAPTPCLRTVGELV